MYVCVGAERRPADSETMPETETPEKTTEQNDYVRVGGQSPNVNGNIRIRPGDEVKHGGRWCRVVEVVPKGDDLDKLLIYRRAAMQTSVESVYLDAIDDYRER